MDRNYWDEREYSRFKLLLNPAKVGSLLQVLRGEKPYDEMPPISVELHLTNVCNLNCPWCTDAELRATGESMRSDRAKLLLEELAALGVGITVEGGGEPTAHPDFDTIVTHGAEHGAQMGLITNGVKKREAVRHMKWVRVSLDSSNAEEYQREKGGDHFDRVMRNIGTYAKDRDPKQMHLGVGYVLTSRNIDGVMNVMPQLDDLGVDYAYLRPVEEAPNITPTREQLYALKQKLLDFCESRRIRFAIGIVDRLTKANDGLACVAHALTAIVQADGQVALCEKRRHDPVKIGNIYGRAFMAVWRSLVRIEASKRLLNPEANAGCQTCRITSVNRILTDIEGVHTKSFI